MLTGQAAKEVGVTKPTIRTWAGRFGQWLSPEAAAQGKTRIFNAEDVQLLKSVKAFRDRNLGFNEIADHLSKGERPTPEEQAPQTALITMAQVQMMLAPISGAADEWRALAQARGQELEALRAETHQLRAELAQARRPWWQRLLWGAQPTDGEMRR